MKFKILILRYLLVEALVRQLLHTRWGLKWRIVWNRRVFFRNLRKSQFYQGISSFDLLPHGNKSLFMEHFDSINTAGIKRDLAFQVGLDAEQGRAPSSEIGDVTVGLSSGTSGNRGVFLVSTKERAKWVAAVLVRVIKFSLKKRKVAFFLRANSKLYESVKSNLLQFFYFNIFEDLESHYQRLLELEPQIVVAQPSVLLSLMTISGAQICPWKVDRVISVAEVLTVEDQRSIQAWFGASVFQVYQCTEGFLAHTCDRGKLHWNSDFIVVEKQWVNEEQYIPRLTDLQRFTQPIVRYELNDIITQGRCDCGLKSDVIQSIDGRSDDVFSWNTGLEETVRIFPDFIRRTVVFASERVNDYMVVKRGEDLWLWTQSDQGEWEKVSEALRKLLLKKGINIQVYALDKPLVNPSGKKKRVLNESKAE
jgi:putative adenylate-forming enzyme